MIKGEAMNKNELIQRLLKMLAQKLDITIKTTGDYPQNRQLLRGICNQLPPMDLGADFFTLQDQLLAIEREEKGVVDVNSLNFENNIALFHGDITVLNADAIVNAGNNQFLGCFIPCHNCIDNVVMSASGFQMRNELAILKTEKNYHTTPVKITKGYNLPCKYVFHVAGPQIFDKVTEQDMQNLADCYQNCLEEAKKMKLANIVFCCLSTGVYCFPNDLACEIAIKTVKNWLKKNDNCLKVVFCTFKEIDKELYNAKLGTKNRQG